MDLEPARRRTIIQNLLQDLGNEHQIGYYVGRADLLTELEHAISRLPKASDRIAVEDIDNLIYHKREGDKKCCPKS